MKTGSWLVVAAVAFGLLAYLSVYFIGKNAPIDTQVVRNSLKNKAMMELGVNVKYVTGQDMNGDTFPDLVAYQIPPHLMQISNVKDTTATRLNQTFLCSRLNMYQIENKHYRNYLMIKPDGLFTIDAKRNPVAILKSAYSRFGYRVQVAQGGEFRISQVDSLGAPISEELLILWNEGAKNFAVLPN